MKIISINLTFKNSVMNTPNKIKNMNAPREKKKKSSSSKIKPKLWVAGLHFQVKLT